MTMTNNRRHFGSSTERRSTSSSESACFAAAFVNVIEAEGLLFLSPAVLGQALSVFPVLGGGAGCIVIRVEDLVVRLVEDREGWMAEQLVVRGRDA